MDLSVVLVNWNSLALTSEALESLQAQTSGIQYEVFVVDNGSQDPGEPERLKERFPWVNLVRNPDNRGFSKANNQGIRRARGRYVLLLNNDTVQVENALGASVAYMDAHPEVGALGITHLNNDEGRTHQASFFPFPDGWTDVRTAFGVAEYRVPTPDFTREQDVDWVVGSYLFMQRSCFEDVGELDERFFIYDEDVDWCLRARRLGWTIRYWPGARMVHLGSAARPFMRDKTFVHFRSHLSYLAKHHGAAAPLYYLGMSTQLGGATAKQLVKWLTGSGTAEDFRNRLARQRQFMFLGDGRLGG